jgi:hypothetical protein
MNLLVLSTTDFPDEFPWEEFSAMYVADDGSLEDFPAEEANRLTTYVVTNQPDEVPETLINQVDDIIFDESPIDYVVSRGIPGDVAVMGWDESDEAYERLERLNTAGVAVLDPDDEWVEVVIDKEVSIENLIETITQRVTADVLRILRQELGDTPRRGRFRSPAPRA